jgi:hypothetical protein
MNIDALTLSGIAIFVIFALALHRLCKARGCGNDSS